MRQIFALETCQKRCEGDSGLRDVIRFNLGSSAGITARHRIIFTHKLADVSFWWKAVRTRWWITKAQCGLASLNTPVTVFSPSNLHTPEKPYAQRVSVWFGVVYFMCSVAFSLCHSLQVPQNKEVTQRLAHLCPNCMWLSASVHWKNSYVFLQT